MTKKHCSSDGGFLERTLEGPFSPGIAGRVLSYADEEPTSPLSNGLYDTPPYSASHSPISQIVDDTHVTITLHPDDDGKYGFNVKGGTTKDVPILVSRVAPNTPADKCNPRLSEGDQVLNINGNDVTHALHADVVRLIQRARATNDGLLFFWSVYCAFEVKNGFIGRVDWRDVIGGLLTQKRMFSVKKKVIKLVILPKLLFLFAFY